MDFIIKNYRCFEDSNPLIFSLQRGFTAFIGPNNAGKSSILKFFYEFRSLWEFLSSVAQMEGFEMALAGEYHSLSFRGVHDQAEIFCNKNERPLTIEISSPSFAAEDLIKDVPRLLFTLERKPMQWKMELWINGSKFEPKPKEKMNDPVTNVEFIFANTDDIPPLDFMEIRESFYALTNSIYIGAFRNAINVKEQAPYFDIHIGTDFMAEWRDWKLGAAKEKRDLIQKLQDEIREIFGYDLLEINDSDLGTFQINVNRKSYNIQELGSGMAQFIIVLTNVAIQKPYYVFIDEPELHLHPSLQMEFLQVLLSYTRHGIAFATHSVGLARSVADNIYTISLDDKGCSKVRDFSALESPSRFLSEMSFNSYSDLQFEKLLLVEGVHDIKTIQEFFRKIHKDGKVVLLPLGGNTMINGNREAELNEMKRITNKIGVIIDSEKDSKESSLSPNREKFVEACKLADIPCHVLEKRAIENYFTEAAIQKVFNAKFHALGEYESLKKIKPNWPKAENWKIAHGMSWDEIKDTDLGEFLKIWVEL